MVDDNPILGVPNDKINEQTTHCDVCGGNGARPHPVWVAQQCPACASSARVKILLRLSDCYSCTVEFFADDLRTFKLNLYAAWQKYLDKKHPKMVSAVLHVSGGTGECDWVDAGWGELRDNPEIRIIDPKKISADVWVEIWRRSIAAHTAGGQFNRWTNDVPGKITDVLNESTEKQYQPTHVAPCRNHKTKGALTMNRITIKQLEALVARINTITGSPAEPYTRKPGERK